MPRGKGWKYLPQQAAFNSTPARLVCSEQTDFSPPISSDSFFHALSFVRKWAGWHLLKQSSSVIAHGHARVGERRRHTQLCAHKQSFSQALKTPKHRTFYRPTDSHTCSAYVNTNSAWHMQKTMYRQCTLVYTLSGLEGSPLATANANTR